MKLSVIIPAYNAAKTIGNCIDSIFNQVDINDDLIGEIIVVNDGSTDNTKDVLEAKKREYPAKNIIICEQENAGVSAARNVGICTARGDWIALLDSDDVWLPNKLSRQYEIISSICNIDFIGCARNNEVLKLRGKVIDTLYKASVYDLLLRVFPQTSTALIRKSALTAAGLYDETMSHSEDADLWLRICEKNNFYYIPDSLVITGSGKENFGHSGLSSNLKKMHLGSLYMLMKCRERGTITSWQKFWYTFFYSLKYMRRIILVRMR